MISLIYGFISNASVNLFAINTVPIVQEAKRTFDVFSILEKPLGEFIDGIEEENC